MIHWTHLEDLQQLDEANQVSMGQDIMLFKHSTTCPISGAAKKRVESGWDFSDNQLKPFYIDLKTFRTVSNTIEDKYNVKHESPQVLIIRDGKCIYDASHFDIKVDSIKEALAEHA